VAARLRKGRFSDRMWMAWNLAGAGIVLVIGMAEINMRLPGPLQVFDEMPIFVVAYDFPLVLAPTVVVPLQEAANLWALANVWYRGDARQEPGAR
jgi:hypothetical protein